jgi:type III secretory pathway component EscT
MTILSTVIGSTNSTIYTSVNNSTTTTIYFCNTGTTAVTINVYAVTSGATASLANVLYYELQITPTDTYLLDTERMILSNGDSIVVSASIADVVTATVSYMGL